MPRERTADAALVSRLLTEKYRKGQRKWWFAFKDLEKAYDRVIRKYLWFYMRPSGVKKKHESTGYVSEL